MINNIITTKDYIINVTSHYNNFMISNIIHGCIDLSENADNFFKNLTKLIKDKPLYKVYGKIPIKLEVDYNKILILSVNRKWEYRIGKSKNWSTVSEYCLHYNNTILKDSEGNDIKGYIIEPASYNPNSAGKNLSQDEQQKKLEAILKYQMGYIKYFGDILLKLFLLIQLIIILVVIL